jgi:hypothetical protein
MGTVGNPGIGLMNTVKPEKLDVDRWSLKYRLAR